jgi:hypothetical protein
LCSGQQLLPSPEIQKEENFGTPANIVEDDTSTDCTDYSDQVFELNYFIIIFFFMILFFIST